MNSKLWLVLVTWAIAGNAVAQSVTYKVTGEIGEELGNSADRLPDVDGDGVDDIVVAGWTRVRVISGSSGAQLHDFNAGAWNNSSGLRVTGLNDVDGDGAGDMVTAFNETSAPSFIGGRLEVRSGTSGSVLCVLQGAHPGARLGGSVAGLGDVNGDGAGDFAASSIEANLLPRVTVFSGATGAALFVPYAPTIAYTAVLVWSGGDIDADGTTDLLVTAREHSVFAYSGATGALIGTFPGGNDSKFATGAGDVDADGYGDVIVGNYGFVPALVYSGRTGQILNALETQGRSAAGLGDVDGDGRDDYTLMFGSNPLRYVIYSGRLGTPMGELPTSSGSEYEGAQRLFGAGDINSDGRNDVAVIDPGYKYQIHPTVSVLGRGRLWVYTEVRPTTIGTPYAFGAIDGPCPCGNDPLNIFAGCANATGRGARLDARGTTSVSADDMHLIVESLPPTTSKGLLGVGTIRSASVTPYADGLRALIGPVQRLRVMTYLGDGVSLSGVDLSELGSWAPGDTRQFQIFYRDVFGPCGSGFNFTNAVELTFVP